MFCLMMSAIENDTDREFMVRLYRDFYPLMRSKAYGIIRDYGTVDDIVNEACIRLIGKISLLRDFERSKLAAYIVYTVRSVSIDAIRRQKARNRRMESELTAGDIERIADNGMSVEEIVIRGEEIEALGKAILMLPERERDVLHFKYTLEMKDEEIARIFSLQTSSVRSLIARTRKKVYQIMREEVKEYGR